MLEVSVELCEPRERKCKYQTKRHFLALALHVGPTHQEANICPYSKDGVKFNTRCWYNKARDEEHSDCSHRISLPAPLVLSNLLLKTNDKPRSLTASSDSEDNFQIVLVDPKQTLILHGRKEAYRQHEH